MNETTTGFKHWIQMLVYPKQKLNLAKGGVAALKYGTFDPLFIVLKLDCLNIA